MTPIFSRIWFVKMHSVLVCASRAVSLRIACDISRACRPTCASPMMPSSSAFGVSAATESMTMTSSAPLRASDSVMLSASSPEVGWATSRLSRSTPMRFA